MGTPHAPLPGLGDGRAAGPLPPWPGLLAGAKPVPLTGRQERAAPWGRVKLDAQIMVL